MPFTVVYLEVTKDASLGWTQGKEQDSASGEWDVPSRYYYDFSQVNSSVPTSSGDVIFPIRNSRENFRVILHANSGDYEITNVVVISGTASFKVTSNSSGWKIREKNPRTWTDAPYSAFVVEDLGDGTFSAPVRCHPMIRNSRTELKDNTSDYDQS